MIEECVRDSEGMRSDILTSLEIIKEAREEDFRPVMSSYYEKLQHFEECVEEVRNCGIPAMALSFNDAEEVCRQALDLVQIGFEQENRQSDRSHNYFSFDAEEELQQQQQQQQQQSLEAKQEPLKPKSSNIFPSAKPSTAAEEKTLRSSNINVNKQKLGYSISQL